MASSLFHKLLRDHHSPIKLISALNKPKYAQFLIPSLTHLLRDPQVIFPPNHCNPNLSQFQTGDPISPQSVLVFPSFPFGYFSNPVSSTGLVPDCASNDVSEEDEGMMWADSVKKKRKRKMNKHKLKKLRKRLRRKT